MLRYRADLENANIGEWVTLVFGGGTDNGTFPEFVTLQKYNEFETAELNKSLFYGI